MIRPIYRACPSKEQCALAGTGSQFRSPPLRKLDQTSSWTGCLSRQNLTRQARLKYFLFSNFSLQEGKDTLSSVNATGAAMLFSAGTFLYVATVHVLPELTMRRSHSPGSHSSKVLRKSELFAIIVGAMLPSLLTIGHHH